MPKTRPKQPRSRGRRSLSILVRISTKEKARLEEAASAAGVGVSTLLRSAGLREASMIVSEGQEVVHSDTAILRRANHPYATRGHAL